MTNRINDFIQDSQIVFGLDSDYYADPEIQSLPFELEELEEEDEGDLMSFNHIKSLDQALSIYKSLIVQVDSLRKTLFDIYKFKNINFLNEKPFIVDSFEDLEIEEE
ncbi:MAG: hypothetical protein INQ03_15775 [Candidatus Heimdallarchaeota archaeon]|nr:hypothetical protein [Candidatus Heimdallarchaeota archaeon]